MEANVGGDTMEQSTATGEQFRIDGDATMAVVIVSCVMSLFIIVTVYTLSHFGQKYDRYESREERPEKPEEKNGISKKKGKQATDKRNATKSQYSHSWLSGTLKGHNGEVTDCDFSSNNKYMATCAEGKRRKRKGRRKNGKTSSENCTFQDRPHQEVVLPDVIRVARPIREVCPLSKYESLPFECDKLYQLLLTYVLSRGELEMYGYPVEGPISQKSIYTSGYAFYCPQNGEPDIKTCCRCRSQFRITDGQYFADNKCWFHWGEKMFVMGKQVYSCCNQMVNTSGCLSSNYHVCQQTFSGVDNFVKTRPKGPPLSTEDWSVMPNYGIYALDCEMCFTANGLEVTKVSVVGADGITVYDSYVLPKSPILDYNTPFSGITEAHMKNVTTTLEEVQAALLRIFNSRTILIGHSLESDLKVLRLMHETVIDTSVVFPHRLGLPFRRSLKSLVSAYLQKQVHSRFGGHDSVEDSRACMELMLYRIHSDWRILLKEMEIEGARKQIVICL